MRRGGRLKGLPTFPSSVFAAGAGAETTGPSAVIARPHLGQTEPRLSVPHCLQITVIIHFLVFAAAREAETRSSVSPVAQSLAEHFLTVIVFI